MIYGAPIRAEGKVGAQGPVLRTNLKIYRQGAGACDSISRYAWLQTVMRHLHSILMHLARDSTWV